MASKMADIQRQLERATGHAAVAAKEQHPAPATISTTTKGLSRDEKIHIGEISRRGSPVVPQPLRF
jgi:hypothetical protein